MTLFLHEKKFDLNTIPEIFNTSINFYSNGINCNYDADWQDVVLKGIGALFLEKVTHLNYINAFGETETQKANKLWGKYIPILPAGSTYQMKDENGRKAVQDITQSSVFGYYDETTDTFTKVNDMSGTWIVPVKYLQSDGNQRINVGLTGNLTWEITCQANSLIKSNQVVVSSSQTAADGTWFGINAPDGTWGFGDSYTSSIEDTNKVDVTLNFNSNGVTGNVLSEEVSRLTPSVHNSWALFATSVQNYGFNGKIWKAKAYNGNDELVRDYMPIKIMGIGGMLDLVEWKLYGNVGTGNFINGSEILYTQIAPDNIICNNGILKYDNGIYADGTKEVVVVTDSDSNEQTAEAVILNKVGDYADIQNLLTGDITKKVAIKVFDGSEDFELSDDTAPNCSWYTNISKSVNAAELICSHFSGTTEHASTFTNGTVKISNDTHLHIQSNNFTTSAELKDWLAEEYIKGTPVIVLYPLENSVIEKVEEQTITAGNKEDYTVDKFGSLYNLDLEVGYRKYIGD